MHGREVAEHQDETQKTVQINVIWHIKKNNKKKKKEMVCGEIRTKSLTDRHTRHFFSPTLQSVSCQRYSLPALWVRPRERWHLKQPYKSRVMSCHPATAIKTQQRKPTAGLLFFFLLSLHNADTLDCCSAPPFLIRAIWLILRPRYDL